MGSSPAPLREQIDEWVAAQMNQIGAQNWPRLLLGSGDHTGNLGPLVGQRRHDVTFRPIHPRSPNDRGDYLLQADMMSAMRLVFMRHAIPGTGVEHEVFPSPRRKADKRGRTMWRRVKWLSRYNHQFVPLHATTSPIRKMKEEVEVPIWTSGMQMRLITVMLILISVVPAMGQDKPSNLDPAGVRGMRMFMREDAVGFAEGADAVFDWSSLAVERSAETIDVAKMRAAFESNILDAERRFAHPVIVRGTPTSSVILWARSANRGQVRRGRSGWRSQRRALSKLGEPDTSDAIEGLTGGFMYGGAHADLSNGNEDLTSSWKPGQKIELLCKGAANTRMALLLNNCVPLATVVANAERVADRQADLLLARKPLEIKTSKERRGITLGPEQADRILALFYFYGLGASSCKQTDVQAWIPCSMKVLKQLKPRERTALEQQTTRDLGILFPPKK